MDISLLVALVLLVLTGLPHGAFDPVLAYRHQVYKSRWGALGFYATYLGITLLGLATWIYQPVFSLLCFLAYSMVHFGRDWQHELPFKGLAYGCIILGSPALFHSQQVHEIFQVISFGTSPHWLVHILQASVGLGMALMLPTKSQLSTQLWLEQIGLFCSAIIFEPLWYFLIYFCFLHSPKHLLEEWKHLSHLQKKVAVKVMTTITMITCLLVLVLSQQLSSVETTISELSYQAIFIGLATLTIPHMLLMAWIQHSVAQPKRTVKTKVNINVV
jgi:Brp/Blh family beta-carotene 15,15'-monooxygenase